MPNMDVQFGGQTLDKPGAYYQDDVSAVANSTPALVPPLVLIGNCYGLPKNVPASFATQNDAVAAVRGGPLGGYLPFIYGPSPELNGASVVTIINVANNTQASITLKDAAGAAVMTIPSANWGAAENLKQVQVSAGSLGGVALTLFDGYANTTLQADNLGLPFTLTYVGAATGGVTMTVSASQLAITSPVASESVTIPLGTGGYATVSDIVSYLNGTAAFTATVVSQGTLPAIYLDAVAAQPIAPGAVTPVTAALHDIYHWLTRQGQSFTRTPAIASGIVSSPTTAPAPIPLTHMTGGTNVPPTLSDYAAGFNAALTIPGWAVFADSNASGVQALGAQHVKSASSIGSRRPRRFVTGSTLGMTPAQAVAASNALGLKECTFCWPGLVANNPTTGISTVYDGLTHAAMTAGMMAGNPVATPLTNKTLSATGLEQTPTDSQIMQLQAGGVQVATIPDQTSVPTILSDVTCWQTDNNPENVFNQQVAIRQYLNYLLVQTLQPYTGAIQSAVGIANQRKAIVAALNGQVVNSTASSGVLASWDASSLSLTYSSTNQVTSVAFNSVPVGQNRFTLITNYVQPLNLTA